MLPQKPQRFLLSQPRLLSLQRPPRPSNPSRKVKEHAVLLSMTGFGEGRGESDSIAVVAEVRTINGRHLKTNYRCSDGYSQLEPQIEAVLRESVRRGSVQVNLKVNRHAVADDFHVNLDVLEGYRRQLGKLASEVRVESLLMLPGVVQMPDAAGADVERDWPAVSAALNAAIERLTAMRATEGEALAADLANQCEVIDTELAGVAERCARGRHQLSRQTSRAGNPRAGKVYLQFGRGRFGARSGAVR